MGLGELELGERVEQSGHAETPRVVKAVISLHVCMRVDQTGLVSRLCRRLWAGRAASVDTQNRPLMDS